MSFTKAVCAHCIWCYRNKPAGHTGYEFYILPRCLAVVIDIADCCQRLSDVIVDHSVHRHGDRVLGQHLLRWNIKADSPHVHDPTLVNARDDEEQARSNCSTLNLSMN